MKTLFRFLLYFAAFSLLSSVVGLLLRWFGYSTILRENGPVEWLEALWCLLCSLFLFLASRKSAQYARLFAVLCLLPLVAATRELDRAFDKALFQGAWAVPACFIVLLACYKAYRCRNTIKLEFVEFMQTQQAVFFGLGFFITVIFAQVFGQQAIMRAVFQQHYIRSIGGFIEEVFEFLGYIILVAGSLECYLRAHLAKERKLSNYNEDNCDSETT